MSELDHRTFHLYLHWLVLDPYSSSSRTLNERCWRGIPVTTQLMCRTSGPTLTPRLPAKLLKAFPMLGNNRSKCCIIRTGDWTEDNIQCNLLVSLSEANCFNRHFMNWTHFHYQFIWFNWITVRWGILGLNGTVPVKCLERTFVVIWCYKNKS